MNSGTDLHAQTQFSNHGVSVQWTNLMGLKSREYTSRRLHNPSFSYRRKAKPKLLNFPESVLIVCVTWQTTCAIIIW